MLPTNKNLSASLSYNPIKAYKVQCVGTTSIDSAIHYKFTVVNINNHMEDHVVKRYSDFKVLHDEIKKRVKKADRDIIPKLPYKGKINALHSRKDPEVVEFRKEALKTYLETLLNSGKLQDIPFLMEFIRTRKEAFK
mmetsp:Transcript_14801/g.12609  ORF Transcript_14801/g.12609 Transcript_14801/m.12609 type:complete len:137 (-) Transcript_14801:53-463(-)